MMHFHLFTNKSAFISLVIFLNILLVLLILNKGDRDSFSVKSDETTTQNYVGKVEVVNDSAFPVAAGFLNSNLSKNEYKQYSLFTQWKLSGYYKDGNYLVESYQEHELYKDEKGKIVKTVPTDNYKSLRYCPGC